MELYDVMSSTLSGFYEQNKKTIDKGYELRLLRELVANGGLFVICKDINGKPSEFEGEWLSINTVYEVEAVYEDLLTDYFAFKLKNIKTTPPYETFNSRRFNIIPNFNKDLLCQ
jgi:hypothetical protein